MVGEPLVIASLVAPRECYWISASNLHTAASSAFSHLLCKDPMYKCVSAVGNCDCVRHIWPSHPDA